MTTPRSEGIPPRTLSRSRAEQRKYDALRMTVDLVTASNLQGDIDVMLDVARKFESYLRSGTPRTLPNDRP